MFRSRRLSQFRCSVIAKIESDADLKIASRLYVVDRVAQRVDTPGLFYQETFTPALHSSRNELAMRTFQQKIRYEKKLSNRRNVALIATGALAVYVFIFCCTQVGDAANGIHNYIPHLFHKLSFDTARDIICYLASKNLLPVDYGSEDPYVSQMLSIGSRKVRLLYPVGLAAGLDLNCSGPDAFFRMGFGNVEVGTVTFHPSTGSTDSNFKVIGSSLQYSETGVGDIHTVVKQLALAKKDLLAKQGLLGVSVLISSASEAEEAVDLLSGLCDYISFDFRHFTESSGILNSLPTFKLRPVGVILKVSSELLPSQELIDFINNTDGVSGVSVGGSVLSSSGTVCKDRSTAAVRLWASQLRDKVVFASGGVMSGADALEKIEAGACLVQVYSAFYFHGARTARMIKSHFSDKLAQRGYYTASEAVGASFRPPTKRMREFARKRRKF